MQEVCDIRVHNSLVLTLELHGNRKKTRCTGIQPCEICVGADASCTYNASYTRGRRQSMATAASNHAQGNMPSTGISVIDSDSRAEDNPGRSAMGDGPADMIRNGHPVRPRSERGHARPGDEASSVPDTVFAHAAPAPSSRTSPEPSQTDRQGHYVGPASGVSFLLRVQKRLHQRLVFSKTSSIFTFGDAPLPDFDPSFFVLPPRDEAQRLTDRYFDFAVPTNRFLHRPTINAWLDELYDTMGVMHNKEEAPARIALLFMVFAQAREYMPPSAAFVNDVR